MIPRRIPASSAARIMSMFLLLEWVLHKCRGGIFGNLLLFLLLFLLFLFDFLLFVPFSGNSYTLLRICIFDASISFSS